MQSNPLLLFVLVAVAAVIGSDAAQVTYYADAFFQGAKRTVDLQPGQCHTLDEFDNQISSINTQNNCVIVFAGRNCRGEAVRIAPGTACHRHLGECGMNDRVSSMCPC